MHHCSAILTILIACVTRPAHINRAFCIPPEFNKPSYDIVVNLAAETRQGQPAELYSTRCTLLAKLCSEKAAETGVTRFIQVLFIGGHVKCYAKCVTIILCNDATQVSTAQVYQCSTSSSPNAQPASEDSPLDPWTNEARSMLLAVSTLLKEALVK